MRTALARLVIAAALLVAPATAMAWWNQDWNFRKEISLDLSAQGADIAGSPADVPVLVRLSLGNFEFWSDAKPDGSDLRVVLGDDKTPLKFHIESWDAQAQMALIWVRVPRMTGGANTDRIFLYYGNPSATDGSDVPGTYDVNQALVFHFDETEGLPLDATAYATNASASTAERTPAALIGGGLRFSGTQSVTVPSNSALRLAANGGFTISMWIRAESARQDAVLASLQGANGALALGLNAGRLYARISGATPIEALQASGEVPSDGWQHVALRLGDGRLAALLNGVEVAGVDAAAPELSGTFTLAADGAGAPGFLGEMDEVQVANVARLVDWLRAAARSQGVDGRLVVYGSDSQKEGGQVSYFGTIAKNLTVDGWVVIVICAFMLVLALFVMVLKATFLSKIEKGNRAFLADFEKLKGDPRALDSPSAAIGAAATALAGDAGKYGASSLYELYHTGIGELNKRIDGGSVGAQRVEILSPQSIEAIRASLDAGSTRLQQRLQSMMVLLTIAISGGPFLGLLGTVIGVMITFAAIAASGDVNVNAIAPGVAAALAATVAGLAVAIPALFGYNWLNMRIKSIVADNRVFNDELVARFAEQYS